MLQPTDRVFVQRGAVRMRRFCRRPAGIYEEMHMRSNTEEAAIRLRTNTEDMAIKSWRQQLDNTTRIVGAVTEGSMRVGELQMRAATEANEMVEQARQLLDKASNPLELWRIQSDWMALSLDRSLNYLNEFQQAAAETQSTLIGLLYEPGSAFPAQANVLPDASRTAFGLMDDAYRRWRETTMQIWEAAEQPLQRLQQQAQRGEGREQGGREGGRGGRQNQRENAREGNEQPGGAQRAAKQES